MIGKVCALFLRQRPSGFWESWHYPGLVILAAAGAVVVARLRGRALGGADPRLLERLVMLAAILVVLSLAGGPSVLLFLRRAELPVLRSGRHVGRGGRERGGAGHPGSLVGSLAVRPAPRRLLRRDLSFGSSRRRGPRPGFPPRGGSLPGGRSTLGGLARQQALGRWARGLPGARVPKGWGATVDRWNWNGLYYRLRHGHPTLNGAEFALLEADLERRGASIDQMNEQGLRFIASLGYNRLAFHQGLPAGEPLDRVPSLADPNGDPR